MAGDSPDPEDQKGSRLGVPFPADVDEGQGDSGQADDGDEGQGDEPDDSEPDSNEGQGDEPEAGRVGSGRSWQPSGAVSTGASWVLGLLLWGWVGLPFLRGGPDEVRRVFAAKFLNKGADGVELP